MRKHLFPLLMWMSASLPASAAVLFKDTFDSGTAASAGYYLSADAATLAVNDGKIRLTESTSTGDQGFFKQFSPATLTDGQTLRLEVTIADTNLSNISSQFKVVIANAQVFTSDQAVSVWSQTKGYAFYIATGSDTSAPTARSVTIGTGPSTIFSSSSLTTGNSVQIANGTGQSLKLVLEITRVNATTINLTGSYNGAAIFSSPVDTAALDYSVFNTVAFGIRAGGNGRYLGFEDVQVSVIPEPSAALLSVLGLGVALVPIARKLRSTSGN